MSRETKKSKETRSKIMQELNIPINMRSSFIRFCKHGAGNYYDKQAYFWDEKRIKWGQYAPVEDRSRVFNTMYEMWVKYRKHFDSINNKKIKLNE